ncbi:MAG: lipopolysaccharide biosynthesis protein [Rhodospirillales bacterium]
MIGRGLLLSGGNLGGALLSLGRNVLIARFIAPEEFGIASTFAITLALIETLSNIAVNQMIVQAPDGDSPKVQASLHGVQLARGLLGALLLFAFAYPYAALVSVPEAAWAYQVMAAVPLLRGLWHLDLYRQQRSQQFRAFVVATVVSQALALAAVWPLLQIGQDYSVMLWAILLQQLAFAALSHWTAERPFRIGWDRAVIGRAIGFGLPLLGNGLLLFAIFHGDRVVIAEQLGMATLGWFSAAVMLTLMPSMVISNTLQSFFLPLVSRSQDEPQDFASAAAVVQQASVLAGAVLAVGVALVGPLAILLLFGADYAPALSVVVWLAIMQGVRVAKVGPTVVAIAKAKTGNPLVANIARALVLPPTYLAVVWGADVVAIAAFALLGEVLAFAVSTALLRRRVKVSLRPLALPVLWTALLMALVALDSYLQPAGTNPLANLHLSQIGLLVGLALLPLTMPDLRRWAGARLKGAL